MKQILKFKKELSKKDILKGLKIPSELSPNLAYLCGVFAGDGSISNRKHKYEYLLKCVGNPLDEQTFYTEVVGLKFEKVFGFIPKMKYQDSDTTFGFIAYSKALVEFLTNFIGLPLGRKHESLTIPVIFLKNQKLLINFIRGLFDTDGCISFKKRYRDYPYYPVISLHLKSQSFVNEIVEALNDLGLKFTKTISYKSKDKRIRSGFTTISATYLYGTKNLNLWMQKIGFYSPKHLEKIKKYKKSHGQWP